MPEMPMSFGWNASPRMVGYTPDQYVSDAPGRWMKRGGVGGGSGMGRTRKKGGGELEEDEERDEEGSGMGRMRKKGGGELEKATGKREVLAAYLST